MKTFKHCYPYIPEAVLLLMSSSYCLFDFFSKDVVNYPMIIVSLVIITLLIWKNKIFAVTLSVLLGLGSICMVLAVFSEFSEFETANPEGISLLITGCILFISLSVVAFFMPFKYFRK